MKVLGKCRVTKAYENKDGTELSLQVGDVIDVLRKGRIIWYGQINDSKGFFPSQNVEMIEEYSSDLKDEDSGSSTVVADKDKGKAAPEEAGASKSPVDPNPPVATFTSIESTAPLEDKRRSRPKSAGRPPSQVFLKENILQVAPNTEIIDISTEDESREDPKKAESVGTGAVSSKMSQLVLEMQQKPLLKGTISSPEISGDAPAWMKALPKRKPSAPSPVKKTAAEDKSPPWMKEVRKRREHKLSLQGDEILPKAAQESTQQNTQQTKIEVYSYETHSTRKLISEECHSAQSKSIKVEARALYTSANQSIGDGTDANLLTSTSVKSIEVSKKDKADEKHAVKETKVIQASSNVEPKKSPENSKKVICEANVKETSTKPVENVVSNLAKNKVDEKHVLNETKVIQRSSNMEPKQSPGNAKKVICEANIKEMSNTPVENVITYTVESVEVAKETVPENPIAKVIDKTQKEAKVQETKTSFSTETQTSPVAEPSEQQKRKIDNSLQMLTKKIDDFRLTSEARSKHLQQEIKSLEMLIDQQYKEVTMFADEIKSELLTLTENKN